MNMLTGLAGHPEVARVGWALVHFVWQGVVLAGVWVVLRLALRRRSAAARYGAGCLVLAAMAAAPLGTWTVLRSDPASQVSSPATAPVLEAAVQAVSAAGQPRVHSFPDRTPDWMERLSQGTEAAMPWVVGLWLAGVFGLTSRLFIGWRQVARLRRRGGAVAEPWLVARLQSLRERMGLSTPVQILKSAWIEVPAVAGWLRPVILLPVSGLTGLSPAQLELLVAHELAHIRRHDQWVSLLQTLLETVLFYHPAVWWVSRAVREEREHCCDDLAVEVCGDRIAYVQALASMEELRQLAPQFALGAGGGSLLTRVRRLLGLDATERSWRQAAGGTLLLLALAAMVLAGLGWAISPRRYEAVARLQIDPPAESPLERTTLDQSAFAEYFATELENLRSPGLLEFAIEKERLRERKSQDTAPNSVAGQSRADGSPPRLTVRRMALTRVVEVIISANAPQEAAGVANTLIVEFWERNSLQRQKDALDLLFFLKNQATSLECDVAKAEEEMQEYLLRTGFVSFDQGNNTIIQALGVAQAKYAEAQARARSASATVSALERHLAAGKPLAVFPPVAADTQVRQLQLDLVRLETELPGLLKAQGGDHPSIRQAQARLEAIRAALDRMLAAQVETLRLEVELAEATERDQADLARNWENRQREWVKAKAKHDLLEQRANSSKTLLHRVLDQMKEIELIQRAKASNIRVVDVASPPARPVYPLRKPALLLCGAGLLAGLGGLSLLRTRNLSNESALTSS